MHCSHCTSAAEVLLFVGRCQTAPCPVCVCVCVVTLKGAQSHSGSVQKMVTFKSPAARRTRGDGEQDVDENEVFDEQNYIQALGAGSAEGE